MGIQCFCPKNIFKKVVLERSDTAIPILQSNIIGISFQIFREVFLVFFSGQSSFTCLFKGGNWSILNLKKVASVFEEENHAKILNRRKI